MPPSTWTVEDGCGRRRGVRSSRRSSGRVLGEAGLVGDERRRLRTVPTPPLPSSDEAALLASVEVGVDVALGERSRRSARGCAARRPSPRPRRRRRSRRGAARGAASRSPVGVDGQLVLAVHASAGGERRRARGRGGVEVLVDERAARSPPRSTGRSSVVHADTRSGSLRAGGGAGRAGRRRRRCPTTPANAPAGKPDGTDEVGEAGHLAAGRGVAGVERVAGGEGGDEPAGSDEVEALEQEVVVKRVAAAVVAGSCGVTLAKGTLPMARSKEPSSAAQRPRTARRGWWPGRRRGAGRSGGGAVGFDADELAAGGARPMKLPEPQPGSRTRPPSKPRSRDRGPHRL